MEKILSRINELAKKQFISASSVEPMKHSTINKVGVHLKHNYEASINACSCSASCGSNYSRNGQCSCSTSCGSNYSR